MDSEALRDQLRGIAERANAFFTGASEAVAALPADDPLLPERETTFWEKLPGDLQTSSKSTASEIACLVPQIVPMVQSSPILTEADERDLGVIFKELKAALALRRHVHWGIEVLHDEGRVLGVEPSGQSDDQPLHPERAAAVFQGSMARLLSILELVTPGASVPMPTTTTTTGSAPGIRPGTAFIMMWMDPEKPRLDDVSDAVKRCFDSFGIRALRSDDIQHEDLITRRILDQIKSAEFLFADLTGERPSVYYEVGFAHAIGRRVILFRLRGTRIHFDLAGYNCPEYENLRDLEEQLWKRLQSVTGESPRDGAAEA